MFLCILFSFFHTFPEFENTKTRFHIVPGCVPGSAWAKARLRTRLAAAAVLSDHVRIVLRVDGVVVGQLDHLFESVVDKDEADERGEAFLCETCEILHQEAGVCGHQHQTEKTRPQADPQPKLEVVKAVVSEGGHIMHNESYYCLVSNVITCDCVFVC